MLRVDLDTDREQVWHRHHDLAGGMHAEESLGLSWCFSRVPLIVFLLRSVRIRTYVFP